MTKRKPWSLRGTARRRLVAALCGGAILAGGAALRRVAAESPPSVTDVLRRQTQEMSDAVALGDVAVWERYVDAGAVYTTEDGTVQNRAQMLGFKPLPAGVSGTIRVVDFQATVHGTTAMTTYVQDEDETYHGHLLHCQYRVTETWLLEAAGWRLIGGEVIAMRTDPPAIQLAASVLEQYCGHYALSPDVHYDIQCAGGTLTGQQSGHKPEALLAEAPDVLFSPGRPRYRMIFHRGPGGAVTGFAERREAWSLEWAREP